MKLIAEKLAKTDKLDHLVCMRADDSRIQTQTPCQSVALPAGAGAAEGLAMFEAAQALGRQWQALPFHQSLTLEFRPHA